MCFRVPIETVNSQKGDGWENYCFTPTQTGTAQPSNLQKRKIDRGRGREKERARKKTTHTDPSDAKRDYSVPGDSFPTHGDWRFNDTRPNAGRQRKGLWRSWVGKSFPFSAVAWVRLTGGKRRRADDLLGKVKK